MVHSVSGWTWGVQIKLWDPLRTHAIPESLTGVFTTRCYTNSRLPYPGLYAGPGVHLRPGFYPKFYNIYLSTWPMTRFLRLWLNFQWPSSCANTANTSSLLHPVFLFFCFSLFSSILSVSSLLSVSATVSLSATTSSLLGSSPASWRAQHWKKQTHRLKRNVNHKLIQRIHNIY